MKRNKKSRSTKERHHERPLAGQIDAGQKKQNANAHHQADKDIEADPELSAHNKNDDLDEGEAARLGEDRTDLI